MGVGAGGFGQRGGEEVVCQVGREEERLGWEGTKRSLGSWARMKEEQVRESEKHATKRSKEEDFLDELRDAESRSSG